jgi:hypothetical protein
MIARGLAGGKGPHQNCRDRVIAAERGAYRLRRRNAHVLPSNVRSKGTSTGRHALTVESRNWQASGAAGGSLAAGTSSSTHPRAVRSRSAETNLAPAAQARSSKNAAVNSRSGPRASDVLAAPGSPLSRGRSVPGTGWHITRRLLLPQSNEKPAMPLTSWHRYRLGLHRCGPRGRPLSLSWNGRCQRHARGMRSTSSPLKLSAFCLQLALLRLISRSRASPGWLACLDPMR